MRYKQWISTLKRLLFLLVLITLVFFIYQEINSSQKSWLITTAFLLSFIVDKAGCFQNRITFIVTGLAAIFLVYALAWITAIPLLVFIAIFLLMAAAVYLNQLFPAYLMPIFMVTVLSLIAVQTTVTPLENASRFIIMSLSVLSIAIIQIPFFYTSLKQRIKTSRLKVLASLKNLNAEIFSCLLQQEYIDNIYLYERRLYTKKRIFMMAFQQLQKISELSPAINEIAAFNHDKIVVLKLDLMFNNMMDYAQLRRKVTDYTTLSICSQELTAIFFGLNKLLENIATNNNWEANIHFVYQQIHNLEDNYHHILQVASREPLVFLLFINSLRLFVDNLQDMHSLVNLGVNSKS